uniref:TIR domain-containing protein n=1 Tax=Periophthalmus magnuspinnatus TaxID=409849 RepID=A0A3B4ASC7_9GOBI
MGRAELVIPELSQGESYHVFCSYSSTDYQWTHALIEELEDRGLRVCDHERDFTAGRPILDNMSESIQQSQKVLLILSAEFVRSRWCLLEANMSMFRDCLQRKPIVPVLLQRDLQVPLHLAHLTCLDVHQPDFRQQLLRVLSTRNQEMQGCTVPREHS